MQFKQFLLLLIFFGFSFFSAAPLEGMETVAWLLDKAKQLAGSPTSTDFEKIKASVDQASTSIDNVNSNVSTIVADVKDIKQGVQTANTHLGALETAGGILAVLSIAQYSYNALSFTKSYFWPNPEKQLKDKLRFVELTRRLRVLEAEVPLDVCLERNKRGTRNVEGLPAACENLTAAYSEAAGQDEFVRMREAFLKNNPRCAAA